VGARSYVRVAGLFRLDSGHFSKVRVGMRSPALLSIIRSSLFVTNCRRYEPRGGRPFIQQPSQNIRLGRLLEKFGAERVRMLIYLPSL
jgi:hypothetical protein